MRAAASFFALPEDVPGFFAADAAEMAACASLG
jgi:hypothetical protein